MKSLIKNFILLSIFVTQGLKVNALTAGITVMRNPETNKMVFLLKDIHKAGTLEDRISQLEEITKVLKAAEESGEDIEILVENGESNDPQVIDLIKTMEE